MKARKASRNSGISGQRSSLGSERAGPAARLTMRTPGAQSSTSGASARSRRVKTPTAGARGPGCRLAPSTQTWSRAAGRSGSRAVVAVPLPDRVLSLGRTARPPARPTARLVAAGDLGERRIPVADEAVEAETLPGHGACVRPQPARLAG